MGAKLLNRRIHFFCVNVTKMGHPNGHSRWKFTPALRSGVLSCHRDPYWSTRHSGRDSNMGSVGVAPKKVGAPKRRTLLRWEYRKSLPSTMLCRECTNFPPLFKLIHPLVELDFTSFFTHLLLYIQFAESFQRY